MRWIAFIFAAHTVYSHLAQLAWYMAKDQNKGELTISVDFRFNFDGLKEKIPICEVCNYYIYLYLRKKGSIKNIMSVS